jgi:hypothetical protein
LCERRVDSLQRSEREPQRSDAAQENEPPEQTDAPSVERAPFLIESPRSTRGVVLRTIPNRGPSVVPSENTHAKIAAQNRKRASTLLRSPEKAPAHARKTPTIPR